MGVFKFTKSPIPDVLIIEAKSFDDPRGFFMETYNITNFANEGFRERFVQDNLSQSKKGVLRGLHYQINPSPMGKLVRCLRGRIFDVGVDARKGSATFGQWYGEVLTGENKKMLYFPPGFAHGLLSLTDDTLVYYKCTGSYSKENERAIIWNDPAVGIKWPLDKVDGEPILSDRDKVHPCLKDADLFI
ncbi:dTDP-4-dehydrorhamnose 3,5-epimerase [Candidatus Margulisiibacteriota bacterium]